MFEGKRNQDRERRSRRWLTERCDRYRDENRRFRTQIAVLWLLAIILGLAFCVLVIKLSEYKAAAEIIGAELLIQVEEAVSINWDSYTGDVMDHPLQVQFERGVNTYRVTCYSPIEGFRETNPVCRGGSVREWVDQATEQGLDGICAAGGQTPWYRDAKHADPPLVLEIEGHGRYLLVDRAAERLGIIDIWVPDLGEMWNHYCQVTVAE